LQSTRAHSALEVSHITRYINLLTYLLAYVCLIMSDTIIQVDQLKIVRNLKFNEEEEDIA